MFAKMLVCLDGSKLAEQILPYATEQAVRFKSQVVLLQVYHVPSIIAAAEAAGTTPSGPNLMKEEIDRREAEAKAYLEGVAGPLQAKGLDVSCVALQGVPGEAIVAFAQNQRVDLIALATHGHSGLGRVVFGSIADQVLRGSGLPILIIRPQDTGT